MIRRSPRLLHVNCADSILRVAAISALLICAGCTSPSQERVADGDTKDTAVTNEQESRPAARLSKSAARLRELTQQSREDLAERLGIDESGIVVVDARHVVWPDSSAGCPMPGFNYTQVLTEGVLIRLQAGDKLHQYHAGKAGKAFLCENPSTSSPPSLYDEY